MKKILLVIGLLLLTGCSQEEKLGAYNFGAENSLYAEFYWATNGTATVIETANKPIMIRQTTTGLLDGWTYNAGSTGSIASYQTGTASASFTRVNDEGHGLANGDIISIRGSSVAAQNGIWTVSSADTDFFDIGVAWDSDGGASDWDEGAYLLAGTNAAGNYAMTYEMAITVAAADTLSIGAYINATACPKCITTRKFANNDVGSVTGSSVLTIADGDRVSLTVKSDSTTSVTVSQGNINLHKL